jgi:arylalkylamine N-acetyltransferase
VAIICKEYLVEFYKGCGFDMVGPSPVVHGKEQWYEMVMQLVNN